MSRIAICSIPCANGGECGPSANQNFGQPVHASRHLRSGGAGRVGRAAGQLAVRRVGAARGHFPGVGRSRVSPAEFRFVPEHRSDHLDVHAHHHVHGDRQPRGDAGRLQPLQRPGAGRSAPAAIGRLCDRRPLRHLACRVRQDRQLHLAGHQLRVARELLAWRGRAGQRAAARRPHPPGRHEHRAGS